jgi:hypothetical protein
MAASSWATYEASKALLAQHGSVAAVKAAAAADPSVVTPLTTGLGAWSDIDARIAAAAKDVDIVIPVRARGGVARIFAVPCARATGASARVPADALPRGRADDPRPRLPGAVAPLLAAVPPHHHPGTRAPQRMCTHTAADGASAWARAWRVRCRRRVPPRLCCSAYVARARARWQRLRGCHARASFATSH